jgi:hypothetical protein
MTKLYNEYGISRAIKAKPVGCSRIAGEIEAVENKFSWPNSGQPLRSGNRDPCHSNPDRFRFDRCGARILRRHPLQHPPRRIVPGYKTRFDLSFSAASEARTLHRSEIFRSLLSPIPSCRVNVRA